MRKVIVVVLLERLKLQVEAYLTEEQAGFRSDRNTTQQVLILRLLAENMKRKGKKVYNCFIDFQKAFDSIKHSITWATMKSYGVGRQLTQMFQVIEENAVCSSRGTIHGRVVHIINRNTTRRPIITHLQR